MSYLSINQKKALLIGAGLLILICCFFFVFQKNQEKTTKLEAETTEMKSEVAYLTELQLKVNDMQLDAEEHKEATATFTKEFPCKVTQQKAIFNVYQMMVDTESRVTGIRPGEPLKFLVAGEVYGVDTEPKSGKADEEPTDVENDPEQEVGIKEMVGKYSKYEVDVNGSLKEIMAMVDWVRDNEEHMSITNLSFSFDSTTGKLMGTATLNYYELNGNGEAYKEPNVKGVTIGTNSVFGVLKK
ncbi:MAG: hypothetical protein J5972_02915 [Eubacterium sp.]|nr:hypothetical protein [Eubacterium sp.]